MDIRVFSAQSQVNVVSLPSYLVPNATVAPSTVSMASFAQQGLSVAQELERFFLAALGQAQVGTLAGGLPTVLPGPIPFQPSATVFAGAAAFGASVGGFSYPRQGAYAAAMGGFAMAATGLPTSPAQTGIYDSQAFGFLAFLGVTGGYSGSALASGYQAAAGGVGAYANLNLAALYGAQAPNSLQASFAYSQNQQQRVTDDPYGVSQSGQGVKSDLANSPEAMLAIQEALKDKSVQGYDDLAKTLKETYGIEASSGDITVKDKDGKEHTVKGVKLGNGDYFIDGNGNGQLDRGDYKFDEAVKNLKSKYNLSDEELKKVTEDLKTRAQNGSNTLPFPSQSHGSGYPQVVYNPQMNMQIMVLFAQAFQLAVA